MRYLSSCLERGGNEVVAMAMYNAGPGRVAKYGTPKMTLNYISRIQGFQKIIENRFMQSLKADKIENYKIKEKKKLRYINLDSNKHSK